MVLLAYYQIMVEFRDGGSLLLCWKLRLRKIQVMGHKNIQKRMLISSQVLPTFPPLAESTNHLFGHIYYHQHDLTISNQFHLFSRSFIVNHWLPTISFCFLPCMCCPLCIMERSSRNDSIVSPQTSWGACLPHANCPPALKVKLCCGMARKCPAYISLVQLFSRTGGCARDLIVMLNLGFQV